VGFIKTLLGGFTNSLEEIHKINIFQLFLKTTVALSPLGLAL
jgi:hypothetical protein